MSKQTKRGFTLIELLVVIAIIGILSAVVLASLNSARDKAADAAVKSNLNNVRAQAELFYDTASTYATACNDPNITAARAAADVANGTSSNTSTCTSGSRAWAMEAQLKTAPATLDYYCVDSAGTAGLYTGRTIQGTAGASNVSQPDTVDCGCGTAVVDCS